MEYDAKVTLLKVTCLLCKRTFNNYFYWHNHMRQKHASVFRMLCDGRISSSLEQYYKTASDEEQNFAEPSSNLQVENGQSLPVTQNGTNVSTSPQNEALGVAATSQDLNTAEQTSFDQTSGTLSQESHTIFSSGQTAMTHNPGVHAEASSDPMNEPSTSYQQGEDKPGPGLFSSNKESFSPEVETSVPDREYSGKKPTFWEYLKSRDPEQPFDPPFNEKDGGRFVPEPPPEPVDLSGRLRAIAAVKNSRVPEKPCAKELFGFCMLPVFDQLTGTTVERPHTVEVQSTTPYEDQDQFSQGPCESPIEIGERILARRRLRSKMRRSEDPDKGNTVSGEGNTVSDEGNTVSDEGNTVSDEENTVSDEGNTVSDEGINVSGEETDETDVEVNVMD